MLQQLRCSVSARCAATIKRSVCTAGHNYAQHTCATRCAHNKHTREAIWQRARGACVRDVRHATQQTHVSGSQEFWLSSAVVTTQSSCGARTQAQAIGQHLSEISGQSSKQSNLMVPERERRLVELCKHHPANPQPPYAPLFTSPCQPVTQTPGGVLTRGWCCQQPCCGWSRWQRSLPRLPRAARRPPRSGPAGRARRPARRATAGPRCTWMPRRQPSTP
jgi:hypothetical protein